MTSLHHSHSLIPKDPTTARSLAGWLAVAAAVTTITLKFGAYALTGSAGLLSDAMESLANLVTAVTTLITVWYASRPIDRSHNYGHGKAEFFAAAVEGVMILAAAVGIAAIGIERLRHPQNLDALGLGGLVAVAASVVNFLTARLLIRVAQETRSPALAADGQHLFTDVWTSVGVLVGLLLVWATGLLWLDALIALALAANIAWTALRLLKGAIDGLMDRSLPQEDQEHLRAAIERELDDLGHTDATYHALRTRQAGSRRFVDFHLLVPGTMSVNDAHTLSNDLEEAVERTLPGVETTVHIEPIEDSRSWDDSALLPLEPEAHSLQNLTKSA
jgi:cation diffusion facilitator family transporter